MLHDEDLETFYCVIRELSLLPTDLSHKVSKIRRRRSLLKRKGHMKARQTS